MRQVNNNSNKRAHLLDQVENRLVVNELDMVKFDSFLDVQVFFEFESVLVEELLQFLVGVVDTKLDG